MSRPEASAGGPVRVLVADDDPILREFAVSHLGSPDIEVVTAGDGAEALAVLQAQAVDIALVDLDMPVMTGFELIAAIRADSDLRHLPVIVITGREDMIAIDEAFAAGANSFVVKPLNWPLLSHQVAYVLRNARTEQHLRAARDQLVEADARKRNVLRLMRHEFNTPLNAIMGFSSLIAQTSSDQQTRSMADDVLAAASDLKRLSDDLFAAAVAASGDIRLAPTTFNLGGLLASAAAAALEETDRDQGSLRVLDRTGDALVTADATSLKLVVRHLLRNALTHGRSAGSAEPVLLLANAQQDQTTLLVSVIDNGPGMPEQLLAKARQSFTQAETALTRSSSGLGLGLAVADAHVGAMGGRLLIGSRPGQSGLIASIVLPGALAGQNPADDVTRGLADAA